MVTLENPNGRFPSAREQEPRLPGGVAVTRLLAGFDGVIQSNTAASHEVRQVVREMQIANERAARMGATTSSLVTQQGDIIKMLSAQVSQAPAAILGGIRGGAVAPVGSGGPAAPTVPHFRADDPYQEAGSTVRPSSIGEPVGSDTSPITRAGAGPPSAPANDNYARIQAARGYSMGQLRQDAGRWVGRQVSETNLGPTIKQNLSSGEWETVNRATGATTGIASESQIRLANVANRVRGVGGMVAEQGMAKGLLSALPAGAAGAAVGVVGGAALVKEGLDFAEEQRAANARYQSILGGSNLEALGARGNEWLFGLSNIGTLDAKQAGQLYQRATGLGLKGDERQDALDLATEKWRRFGMDVNKTMDLIAISSRSGLHGLTGIAEGIDAVTESARGSGVNAETARENYAQAYGAAAGTLVGEGSAAVAAGALTAAFADLGPAYAGVDVGAAFSNDIARQLGAGQKWTEAQTIANTSGAQGGQQYTRMVQGAILDIATRLLGARGRAIIVDYKRRNAVPGSLSNEQASQVAIEIMQANIINPSAAQASIKRATNLDIPLNQAVAFLVSALDGNFNPEAQVQQQAVASNQTTISVSNRNSFDITKGGAVETMGDVITAMGGDVGLDVVQDAPTFDAEGNVVEGERRMVMETSNGRGRQSILGARGLYAGQVQQSGLRSPIVEEALRQGDQDQKFRINVGTESAPDWREMSMYDAIKYRSDQLARGDVLVTEGAGKGQTLATALGKQVDENVAVNYDTRAGATAGEKWTAGTGTGSGTVTGQIEVFASPELQRLLRFRPIGDTTVIDPPSSITSAGSLPSGSYTGGS